MQKAHKNNRPFKPIFFITCLAVIAILIQSCDPARILVLKASKNPDVSVTVYGNNKILPGPHEKENEKIVIKIPATGTSATRDTVFYYGFGGWPKSKFMTEFSKNIDSIIIINSNSKIVLDNLPDITNYLSKHRHGFAKRILTIEDN